MKSTQVIDVKPTLTEKEFLRSILVKVASSEGAPFDVAEKMEFGDVRHTADYILVSKYKEDWEYSAIIGHHSKLEGTSYKFTQWQEEPYIGVVSSNEVCASVLERENSEDELYKWEDQTDCAKSFIENKLSNLSTEILDKIFEIPSSETEGWVDYEPDVPDYDDDDSIEASIAASVLERSKLPNVFFEIPADEYKDVEFLRSKKEIISNNVYKLHYYEVSYMYKGQTYYAKAIANKESNELLLASDEAFDIPREEKSLDEILSNKQKNPMILANASWILTYASAAVPVILSFLGNSSLWYLSFIMVAAAIVVTIICNGVAKSLYWSVYKKYCGYCRRNNIMPLLHRRIEKLGLGALTEDETTKAMEMFEDPEFPESEKVIIGGKMKIAIPVAMVSAFFALLLGGQ